MAGAPIEFNGPRRAGRGERAAVSLLEILIALTILGSLIGAFARIMTSSGRQMTVTGSSFLAMQLASKVMTDLVEESRNNAAFLEFLERFPDMTTRDLVVDAQSVYFRYLGDRQAPYGRIDPAVDGGLRPADGAAYQQFAPFHVKVEASRLASADSASFEKHLARIRILVDWQEKDGQKRSYELESLVPSPVGPPPLDPWLPDPARIDAMTREALFPDHSGQTLDAAIAATGADGRLIRHAGKIVVLTASLCKSLRLLSASLQDAAAEREGLLSPLSARVVPVQIGIAQGLETAASLIYRVLQEVTPDVEALNKDFTPTAFRGADLTYLSLALDTFFQLPPELILWLRATESSYEWLGQDGLRLVVGQKELGLVKTKTGEAKRVRFALQDLDARQYQAFVDQERAAAAGSNPFMERFYLRETSLITRLAEFRAAYPNLAPATRLVEVTLPEVTVRLPAVVAQLPPLRIPIRSAYIGLPKGPGPGIVAAPGLVGGPPGLARPTGIPGGSSGGGQGYGYGNSSSGNSGQGNSYGNNSSGNSGQGNSYGNSSSGNSGQGNSYGNSSSGNSGQGNSYGNSSSGNSGQGNSSSGNGGGG